MAPGTLSQLASIPAGPAPPPGAAESLATEDTAADDLSESGSDLSGGSFSEAAENAAADEDYLTKDLGASVNDDLLAMDGAGGRQEETAEALIARMRKTTVAEGVEEE